MNFMEFTIERINFFGCDIWCGLWISKLERKKKKEKNLLKSHYKQQTGGELAEAILYRLAESISISTYTY